MVIFKVVLLGDGAVGKTSLRNSFLGRVFSGEYQMTIGAEVTIKNSFIGEKPVKFQVWDLAGQPRFLDAHEQYYKGSTGALIVFDITRPDSFENVQNWINGLWQNNGKGEIPFIIVGNKIDLRDQAPNPVSDESGYQYAQNLTEMTQKLGFAIHYIDTSAKTGEKVDAAFQVLGNEIVNYLKTTAKSHSRFIFPDI